MATAICAALALGIALSLTSTLEGTEPLTLAGMTDWRIVCAPSASPAERYAAEEFRSLLAAAGGAELPIVESADGQAVFIGPDAVAASGRFRPAGSFGEEELRISIAPDAICIDGGRPRGTLYGVYEFFEELCGFRFLTFDHTYVPPDAAQRRLPYGTRSYNPPFAFRWSYYGETSRRPDFAARLRTNTVTDDPRLGGRTGFRLVNHNVAHLVPPAKYGETHPEYYALVDGKRRLGTHGGGPQLCLTNPEVLDVVTEAVLNEIKRDPTARNINIAQMDNADYCTCPTCAALDAKEGSHSATMLSFVNAVAERIARTHPDVVLSTFAYWYTRKPPRTLRAHRNVMVQLCSIECCQFHAIDDPSCALNREFCRDMATWKTRCDKVFIWHYNTNFSAYMLPFPNLRSIGRSVAYFARNNGRGVFMQAAGNGFSTELSDLRNYVMSRCLWKPGRDSWKEAQEFCRMHYAESAGPILAYLDEYHKLIAERKLHPTCFATESALGLDGPTAQRIFERFGQAMALAQSDPVRSRVEKASLCAYRAALSASSSHLVIEEGRCKPDLAGYDPDLLDRYASLCDRHGVTMESETVPKAGYIETLRNLYKGMRAVTLENEAWRVSLLPESNGKLVEMIHKPTGRNVIRPSRAFNRFRYEDWVRDGEGPGPNTIMAYETVEQTSDRVAMVLTTPDGTRFERAVSLRGDAIRIDGAITAKTPRSISVWLHPEYDAATSAADPQVVSVYVRAPKWVRANQNWKDAQPTSAQSAVISNAASGGAFAYYNHRERFGIEQRFDPDQIGQLGCYWSPARRQVNLELVASVSALGPGETTRFWYEVRHLSEPPDGS